MEVFLDVLGVYFFLFEVFRKFFDFCFVVFFGLMIDFRLGIMMVLVLNKVDIVEDIEGIWKYFDDIEYFMVRLKFEFFI